MKRTVKNIIMILMIVALGAGAYFTMDYAGTQLSSSASTHMRGEMGGDMRGFGGGMGMPDMGEMPSMPGDAQSSDNTNDNANSNTNDKSSSGKHQKQKSSNQDNNSNSSEQPSLPEGNAPSGDAQNSNEPPAMPEGDSQNGGTPPEMPSDKNGAGQDSFSNGDGTMTEAPQDNFQGGEQSSASEDTTDNANPSTFTKNEMPAAPDFAGTTDSESTESQHIDTFFYVLLGVEMLLLTALLVYLIMSGFNKKDFYQTLKGTKRIIIYVLVVLVAASALTYGASEASAKLFANTNNASATQQMMPDGNGGQGGFGGTSTSVEAGGATAVDGSEETLSGSYSSTESDESAILVTNGGTATISGATVDKSAGDSTNTENSEFYGVNAGILVQENSSATITGATISTNAKGANAVFATGENAKITIKDSTVTTTGSSSSRGLDATYGGTIEADNVTVTTQGGSCAALATDRGEGTVTANNSTLETNGAGSPVIYSTGNISIDNTTGTANGAQTIVIEGKNSATVTNSTLTASGKGNRNDVDNAGVMIYQSMSGDAGEGTGTLTAENSTLEIQSTSDYYTTAPMFFITNTDAVINLTNTKLVYGSGILISAKGTNEWGKEGSNGGNVTLNATNQTLSGSIELDSISSAAINLNASSYEGTINGDNSAKEVTLTLDANSTVKLTGDSYVTALEDADSTYANIDFNGYTLYVNGTAIN